MVGVMVLIKLLFSAAVLAGIAVVWRRTPVYEDSIHLREEMVLSRPGDIINFRPISEEEYQHIDAEVQADRYEPNIKPVHFDLAEFERDIDGYNARLVEVLK